MCRCVFVRPKHNLTDHLRHLSTVMYTVNLPFAWATCTCTCPVIISSHIAFIQPETKKVHNNVSRTGPRTRTSIAVLNMGSQSLVCVRLSGNGKVDWLFINALHKSQNMTVDHSTWQCSYSLDILFGFSIHVLSSLSYSPISLISISSSTLHLTSKHSTSRKQIACPRKDRTSPQRKLNSDFWRKLQRVLQRKDLNHC